MRPLKMRAVKLCADNKITSLLLFSIVIFIRRTELMLGFFLFSWHLCTLHNLWVVFHFSLWCVNTVHFMHVHKLTRIKAIIINTNIFVLPLCAAKPSRSVWSSKPQQRPVTATGSSCREESGVGWVSRSKRNKLQLWFPIKYQQLTPTESCRSSYRSQ